MDRSSAHELVVEQFPDGIVFLFEGEDPPRYTLVGGQGLAAVGMTKETLEGQPVAANRPADVREPARAEYRRALAGEERTFEAGAEGRHFRVHLLPVTDDDGTVSAGLGVALDITEEVLYREALERQNQRLERLTDLVFHDLRNPLSVAKGRLELLAEDVESEHLGPIADALDRMEELTQRDATLADVDDSFQPLDLAAVARDAWDNVSTGDATLHVETTRTVRGDEAGLRRLFENLYRNAVEHGASATITVRDTETGFAVDDDGRGIPEERRDSLFDHGVTFSADGTGLGLYIVRNIADAHGWSVEVGESGAGGARFSFSDVENA